MHTYRIENIQQEKMLSRVFGAGWRANERATIKQSNEQCYTYDKDMGVTASVSSSSSVSRDGRATAVMSWML